MPDIVPFGKYKGQPVEALAQDKAYCDWLTAQDWFRSRFTSIHTLIVNNFGEPHETPEHNLLQAMFLDEDWLKRFMSLRCGESAVRDELGQRIHAAWTQQRKCRTEIEQRITSCLRVISDSKTEGSLSWLTPEQRQSKLDSETASLVGWRAEALMLDARVDDWKLLFEARPRWESFSTEFEVAGIDVIVTGVASLGVPDAPYGCLSAHGYEESTRDFFPLRSRFRQRIECKPQLGDDYPAVLRQMRASDATTLVIESCAASISLGQIRKLMAPIVILTRDEIDTAAMLPGDT